MGNSSTATEILEYALRYLYDAASARAWFRRGRIPDSTHLLCTFERKRLEGRTCSLLCGRRSRWVSCGDKRKRRETEAHEKLRVELDPVESERVQEGRQALHDTQAA